ncbi:MAG: hypothetical protein Q8761_02945, partial [Sweet potato little leaf phytoplasma]|nr:hypothetical protein [Sweet potato little leaf phytoplasma]
PSPSGLGDVRSLPRQCGLSYPSFISMSSFSGMGEGSQTGNTFSSVYPVFVNPGSFSGGAFPYPMAYLVGECGSSFIFSFSVFRSRFDGNNHPGVGGLF